MLYNLNYYILMTKLVAATIIWIKTVFITLGIIASITAWTFFSRFAKIVANSMVNMAILVFVANIFFFWNITSSRTFWFPTYVLIMSTIIIWPAFQVTPSISENYVKLKRKKYIFFTEIISNKTYSVQNWLLVHTEGTDTLCLLEELHCL